MKFQLKPANQQVMVITGATSGIGLTLARMAAKRGVKLVLVARNAEALEQLAQQLGQDGAQVEWVAADVADKNALQAAVTTAHRRFGGFDTWVNNAGVSIFGRFEDVPIEDQHRLFDTNFWGVVNGSLLAAEQLRARGGAIINIGSQLSDHAVPLQGMYSASKHAVKGFTDALRLELEEVDAPVAVTLIKPASIDTMFIKHAKNYLDVEPKLPAPIYAPEVVADAVLHAAVHPTRDLYVGATSRLASIGAKVAPRLMDTVLSTAMSRQQRSPEPPHADDRPALYEPGEPLSERDAARGRPVLEHSLYTKATMRPKTTFAVAVAAAVAAVTVWNLRHNGTRGFIKS
ncbi:MAG TPA: SDR family oxidoreductase [Burkholderiaceae bacterium]|nr:SDR family oxidoreductase [Burkholderiaceae bacterium]